MNQLPDVIYAEIASCLEYNDCLRYFMTNTLLSNIMLKRGRMIGIFSQDRGEETMRSYQTSQTFRDKLHRLIHNPYQQLKLEFSTAAVFQDTITCSELETRADLLLNLLMNCVKKVHRLKLKVPGFLSTLLNSFDLQLIVTWINNNNPSLSLKGFSLSNYNFTDLPIIHNLESLSIEIAHNLLIDGLHISAYRNLRQLSLCWCKLIQDVSCLDGIHDLLIQGCEGIRDISCLNHNYKIAIESCNNIVDYSNCFRYSKIVRIRGPMTMHVPELNLDFSKLLEVRELDIGIIRMETPIKVFLLPSCRSLRRLLIQAINLPFSIPSNHNIREILINYCPSITSFRNIDNICSVKLSNLGISSLEGLGVGNRIVEISLCPNITDFSLLRHCNKISIFNCRGFQDFNQVRGVKDFSFSPFDERNVPEDMEGVTCLKLDTIELMKVPSSVTELKLHLRERMIQQLPSFLSRLPHHVRKIQFMTPFFETINKVRSMMEYFDNILSQFTIEFIKVPPMYGINVFRKH